MKIVGFIEEAATVERFCGSVIYGKRRLGRRQPES
jgi:hypothetical protein